MPDKKKDILSIMQIIHKELQNISSHDFELVLKGEAKIDISIKPKIRKKNIKSDIDLDSLEAELRLLGNREKGLKILESRFKTREELSNFAKKIDVPVLKSDKVGLIKKRIVESTIGYRLRSNSIQNK